MVSETRNVVTKSSNQLNLSFVTSQLRTNEQSVRMKSFRRDRAQTNQSMDIRDEQAEIRDTSKPFNGSGSSVEIDHLRVSYGYHQTLPQMHQSLTSSTLNLAFDRGDSNSSRRNNQNRQVSSQLNNPRGSFDIKNYRLPQPSNPRNITPLKSKSVLKLFWTEENIERSRDNNPVDHDLNAPCSRGVMDSHAAQQTSSIVHLIP